MNHVKFYSKLQYEDWISYMQEKYNNWKFLGGNPNKYPLMVVYNISHDPDEFCFCIVNDGIKD